MRGHTAATSATADQVRTFPNRRSGLNDVIDFSFESLRKIVDPGKSTCSFATRVGPELVQSEYG